MAKNEQTSERVASIAAKILEMENPRLITDEFWKDIQSVAGTALTQTQDKPKSTSPLLGGFNRLNGLKEIGKPNLKPSTFKKFSDLKKK